MRWGFGVTGVGADAVGFVLGVTGVGAVRWGVLGAGRRGIWW